MKVVITGPGPLAREAGALVASWLQRTNPESVITHSSEESLTLPALERLTGADLAVLCVTPENSRSAFLYFEAGVLLARTQSGRFLTLLIGVSPADFLGGPLGHLPWKEFGFEALEALTSLASGRSTGLPDAHRAELHTAWNRWVGEQRRGSLSRQAAKWLASDVETDPTEPDYTIAPLGEAILLEAVKDRRGSIIMVRTLLGLHLQVNGKLFAEPGNARSEAEARGVIRQLLHDGLIESKGSKGELLSLTSEGYRVADALVKRAVTK